MNSNDQSPQEPISLCDASGKIIGALLPGAPPAQDDFFDEGSPGFFRELERRRQDDNYVSVEEALRHLRNGDDPK